MAYGDAFASIIGEKYGRRHYSVFAKKSIEGSLAMFAASFLFLVAGLSFMSILHPFSAFAIVLIGLGAAFVATLAEALSPLGFDNITVPALSVLTVLLLTGGL